MKYDAYILYRSDNILHKHVAVTLQKLLEHFRTPGLKRIQRVFLDETELSADYQADKQVMDALKASRYLIIIGQDSSGDDIWQSKEVKFFLKTHKPSDVLTILAVQNPKQSENLGVIKSGRSIKCVWNIRSGRNSSGIGVCSC